MSSQLDKTILDRLAASNIKATQQIQSLWSGYGQIVRYELEGCPISSVVVKHVKLPETSQHPRGWNTDHSHQRKIKSYQVESNWYQNWSSQCDDTCRVPKCYAVESSDSEFFMLLEDLDACGYSVRKESVTLQDMKNCLKWLANFHAIFLNNEKNPDNQLWRIGTYWHLDTRPDELDVLDDLALKQAAPLIDKILNACRFKTLVHGDAKLANFCFADKGDDVAAVDFQYIGGGCGMKDVAYFIGSCLYEEDCEKYESELMDFYFQSLTGALQSRSKFDQAELKLLEKEWREMFYYAWADFHRFLKGWSPGHWKVNDYSERMAKKVIASLSE